MRGREEREGKGEEKRGADRCVTSSWSWREEEEVRGGGVVAMAMTRNVHVAPGGRPHELMGPKPGPAPQPFRKGLSRNPRAENWWIQEMPGCDTLVSKDQICN